MPIIRDLLVKIGFLSDGKGLRDVESSISRLKHSALLIGEAIAGAEFAMFELLKTTAEEAFEIKRLSGVMGIATNDFQLLSKAASLSEVDMESFTLAMRRFGVVTGEAMRGGKAQIKSFAEIGVTAFKNSNGTVKNQVQLLQEVADKIMAIKAPQERLAATYKIFGRQGVQIINFIKNGAKGMKDLTKTVSDFGYIFSKEDMDQGEEFVDNLKLTKLFLTGLKDEIGAKLLPETNKYIATLKEWVKENRKLIVQNIEGKIKGINTFLKATWNVLSIVFGVISKITDALGGMNNVLNIAGILFGIITSAKILRGLFGLITPLIGITKALISMDFWASAIPALLIALGAAIYLIYDDVKNFLDGNKSFIGYIIDKYPKAASVIQDFADSATAAFHLLEDAGNVVLKIFNAIVDSIQTMNSLILPSKFLPSFGGASGSSGNNQQSGIDVLKSSMASLIPAYGLAQAYKAYDKSRSGGVNVSPQTVINMTVPAGTSESQQNWLEKAAAKVFDSLHQDVMRGVMNSLPVTEN